MVPLTSCAWAFQTQELRFAQCPLNTDRTLGGALSKSDFKEWRRGEKIFFSIKEISLQAVKATTVHRGLQDSFLCLAAPGHYPATVATTGSLIVSPEHSAGRMKRVGIWIKVPQTMQIDVQLFFPQWQKKPLPFVPFGFPQRVLALFSWNPSETAPGLRQQAFNCCRSSSRYH